MELLATAFAPEFRTQLYTAFTEVQERLGTINDCATANQLFEKWAVNAENVNVTVTLNEMANEERRRLEIICDEFRQLWTTQRTNQLWETVQEIFARPDVGLTLIRELFVARGRLTLGGGNSMHWNWMGESTSFLLQSGLDGNPSWCCTHYKCGISHWFSVFSILANATKR